MNSDKIQTQLMPKEWVKWKPSILKNDGKLYKIEYIVEEKDEKKIEIEEVTKIEETDASFKIYFSVNQKNILNSGGSIIIKKGTFPVDAKVTQINACSDGSTENLENKSIHRAKSTKRLHSEPSSDYKRKLRSNSTKFPQNEQITKEPEPKLQIVNNQNIPAQRLGDEITKNILGNISGAQEVSVEDHREETAIKVAKPYRIKTRSFGIENRKMMSSDNIQTQLMPKEWVKWKPSILKNDGKLYKIEYIVEEKDEKKIEIDEVTKIEETDASFKIQFSVNQKNILNSGGSIIIKKGTFPVNAKVTQINACSDGSTENLENKSIHRAKSTKKLHSEPNSDYKKKLRSNSTKFPQNEQITKEPEPKLQIVNNQNIPAQRLGDEITKNIPGNISGAQEVSVEDHREETAIKISNLLNSGFSSISNKDKKKIIKLLNLCEPTDEIFNNSNIVSPELVYFILNGESTSLEKETSTANLCEPTNQIVNNLNVSSQELVNEPNSIIEQMDNEGIEEKEKITEDITTETDVMIIVENDPIDPNKPRKWKQEITTICKITTITNIKEIHT